MKKIICFMFCAAIAGTAWSQELQVDSGGAMHVSPNSYVYVNGNIAIHASGSFSLASNDGNSSSLLVTGTATGDISYARYVKDVNWHFVSVPVTTQNVGTFATNNPNAVAISTAGNYGISKYNNNNAATTRWEYFTVAAGSLAAASAGNFVNGKGYSNLRTAAGNYTFKGNMANADVSITIPEGDGDATSHHWALVGNPYPSFLAGNTPADAANLLTQNLSILKADKAAIYVWDLTTSTYEAVNHSDDALYIAPGQGFMVEAKANGQSFMFPKALQKPQSVAAAIFYRLEPMARVTLFLSDGTTEKRTRLRYLDANATTGLDVGYDAGSYRDGTPSFSIDTHLVSNSTGTDFTIQCLPKENFETMVVSLAVYAKANDVLSFRTEVENLPDGISAYIEDKVNNTITEITNTPYSVTVDTNQNGIGRFYLHTAQQSILNIDNVASLNISIYMTDNSVLRIAGLQAEGTSQIKIFTITGKEVMSTSFKTKNVNDIQLPKLSKGIYIVQVVSNKGKHSKKITIQ